MNRIYKLVWSKVKNCWIVVSEFAKSYSKIFKGSVTVRTVVISMLACMLTIGLCGVSFATSVYEGYVFSDTINSLTALTIADEHFGSENYYANIYSFEPVIIFSRDGNGNPIFTLNVYELTGNRNKVYSCNLTELDCTRLDIKLSNFGDNGIEHYFDVAGYDSIAIGSNSKVMGGASTAIGALSLSVGNNSIAIGTNAIAIGNNANQDSASEIRNTNNQIQQNLMERKTEYKTSYADYDNTNHYVSSLKSRRAINCYNQIIVYQNEIDNILQPQLEVATEQYNISKARYDALVENKNEAISKLSNLNFNGYYDNDGSVNREAFTNQLKTNIENNTTVNLPSSFYSNYVNSYLASLNNNPLQTELYSFEYFSGTNRYYENKIFSNSNSTFMNYLKTFKPNTFNDVVNNSTFSGYSIITDSLYKTNSENWFGRVLFPTGIFFGESDVIRIRQLVDTNYSFSDYAYSSRISNLNSVYQNNKSAYASLLNRLENDGMFTSEEKNSLSIELNKELDYGYQLAYAIADMGHEHYLLEKATTEEEKNLHYQNLLNIKNNINIKYDIIENALSKNGSVIGYDINTGELFNVSDRKYGDFTFLLRKFLNRNIYENYSTISQLQEIADKTISNELEITQNRELVDSANNSVISINSSIENNQRKINNNQEYLNTNNLNNVMDDYENALADLEQKQLKMNADAEALAEAEQQLSAFLEDLSSGENAIAIGTNSLTTGKNAIGMGSLAVVTGEDAVGIGRDVILTAEKAVAVGPENTVSAENSVALGSENAITAVNSIAIGKGNVVSGSNSVALGNNINVTEDNVVSVGNRRIMGVATGVADTDAVNVKQLNDALQTVTVQGSGVGYDAGSTDKITLAGDNGTKITNLKQGTLSATSTDAVTGAQLYATNQNVSGFATDITRNKNSIRNLNTSVTTALSSVSSASDLIDTLNNVKADTSLNNLTATGKQVIANTALSVVQDYLSSYSGTANPVAPMAYNPNTLSVTDAGNGSLSVGEGSNVNGSSSIAIGVGNQVNANNAGAFGDPSIINADESYVLGNDDTVNTGAVGSFIVGNDSVSNAKGGLLFGSNSKTKATAENSIGLGNNTQITGKGSVALGYESVALDDNVISVGNDLLKRKITNVADGSITADSNDAVTGKQLYAINEKVEANTLAVTKKADIDASNIDTVAWTDKLGIGKVEENNGNLVTGGTVFNAITAMKQNNPVQATNEAIFIGANQTDNLISVYNQNGEGRIITGVMTNPEDTTSAANVGYVNVVASNVLENINGRFVETDKRMNKVGANAAALASLTPASFEGDEKWSLAASVGHYKGETAGAVGAFYKPAENVMMNVRGAVGNGENMIGAGVAVSLTKGDIPGVTKRQLAVTVNKQAEAINALQQNQQMMMQAREKDQQLIAELMKRLEAVEKRK